MISEKRKRHIQYLAKLNIGNSYYKNRNYIFTQEHKDKIGASKKGIELSDSHKNKIKIALKGRTAWNKGKKLSKEHILNSSNARKGKVRAVRVEKTCPVCKIVFYLLPSRSEKEFCSRPCAILGRKKAIYPNRNGENNSKWKGGITKLRTTIWRSDKYKTWRTNIFIKYNKTCQTCGVTENLQVHHTPLEFAEILSKYSIRTLEDAYGCDILWDEDNGKVLCVNCHRKTYKYKGNQYESFHL